MVTHVSKENFYLTIVNSSKLYRCFLIFFLMKLFYHDFITRLRIKGIFYEWDKYVFLRIKWAKNSYKNMYNLKHVLEKLFEGLTP